MNTVNQSYSAAPSMMRPIFTGPTVAAGLIVITAGPIVGASVDARHLQETWSEIVDGADAISLGAEPAPVGPIPVLLEGVRDAENTLDPDEMAF